MKSQLKKLVLGVMLTVMPMMATTVSAQWTQQGQASGVVVNIGDSILERPVEHPSTTKSIHTVALSQNGTLTGQVTSIDASTKSTAGLEGLDVFFVQDGKVVRQAQTRPDGSFEIQDLPEGAYSFFAAGEAGFAASGVYVTKRNWGDANSVLESTIASINYSGIQKMIRQNVPAEVRQAVGNSNQIESNGAAFNVSNQIRLINGRISGQISSLFGQHQNVSGVQVHLIQNDDPISQVQTNSLGEFSFPDVEPGVYDIVAASKSAMAVGRFEAIGNSSLMTQVSYRKTINKLEFALTQTLDPQQDDVVDEIVFQDGVDVLMEQAPGTMEFAGESFGLGGASGGSAGTTGNFGNIGGGTAARSGGFGAGGAGMRRLFLLGGVGGIIAISTSDPDAKSPVDP